MKRVLLFLFICSILSANSSMPMPIQGKFPKHLDECIDGYLYRVFIDDKGQIIPSSIHQVLEKSSLHEKILPKTCKIETQKPVK
ncbi:hypothetical protein [Helicobacter cappadocius]|uniref:Uncharacterized protein n=1 Tax=Helicobacter cappadocius TaxID=3063998 RepID=A0AA90PVH6_9HELI|nr:MULTISPECIES: hypothetical protein [unclassified Helicobacter]MDO7253201.1 hypothetical protein [Helicobacter sp. faydin-H75]MDP2539125.1 hypothetical protein [Helicobacter sp. faydin-H76]